MQSTAICMTHCTLHLTCWPLLWTHCTQETMSVFHFTGHRVPRPVSQSVTFHECFLSKSTPLPELGRPGYTLVGLPSCRQFDCTCSNNPALPQVTATPQSHMASPPLSKLNPTFGQQTYSSDSHQRWNKDLSCEWKLTHGVQVTRCTTHKRTWYWSTTPAVHSDSLCLHPYHKQTLHNLLGHIKWQEEQNKAMVRGGLPSLLHFQLITSFI